MPFGGFEYIRKAKAHRPLIKVSGPEAIERLRAAAARMEPRLRSALEKAIESARLSLDENVLADLVGRGNVQEILNVLSPEALEDHFQEFAAAMSQSVLAGASVAADLQPPVTGFSGGTVNFVFNATNPRLADFAQRMTTLRIRELSEDVRLVTRDVVQRGVLAGQNPRTIARDVRQSIGLTAHQERAVQNYRRMLETNDVTALQRSLRDRRFDPTLRRAIENGVQLSDDQINRMVERYRSRYVKYRSEVISRTEAIRSVQGAQHELFQSYIDAGRIVPQQVRRFWHHTADERTRAGHRLIAQMNAEGVGQDEPFQTPLGPLMYPADPNGSAENVINCRCTVFSRVVSMELLDNG